MRVVLRIRQGSLRRGDLAIIHRGKRWAILELAPRHVRLLLALVLAYHLAPPVEADAVFDGDPYRGQVHPAKLGQYYARVLDPSACIEARTVRTYVSELRKVVERELARRAPGEAWAAKFELIVGGDGYRIGPAGLEVTGYPTDPPTAMHA